MINKNWSRWIKASCIKYFKDQINANSINLFIEGDVRNTEGLQNWVEFRIDGPTYQESSKDYFKVKGQIDFLCTLVQSDSTNLYSLDSLSGLIASMFGDICVYRYGNGPDDDQTLLDVFKLVPSVRTTFFGLVPNTSIVQCSVEAQFKMVLTL